MKSPKNRRIKLQKELSSIEGVKKAYFQPPASVRMQYPCIVYELSNKKLTHADNSLYQTNNQYTVTVIDSNPDSNIPDLVLDHFLFCSFDRQFKVDNLYHNVLTLYY